MIAVPSQKNHGPRTAARAARHHDTVVTIVRVHRHLIERAVPVVPPATPAKSTNTDVTSVPVRSLTVTVFAAPPNARKSTFLDIIGIHRDRRHIPEEPQPGTIRRHVNVLRHPRTIEQQQISTLLALHHVTAVTPDPELERVVTHPQQRHIVTPVPIHQIVAPTTGELIHPGTTKNPVVAVTTIDRQLDHVRGQRRHVNGVIARQPVHREKINVGVGVGDR